MSVSSGDAQILLASFCALLQATQISMYSSSMYAYLKTLDEKANDANFSWILAISSVGQGIGGFVVGHLAEHPSKIQRYLLIQMLLSLVSNIIYLFLPLFESVQILFVMMTSRFIAGLGGNIALLRYFASTHSDRTRRSRAMACLSAGSAAGSLLGAGIIVFYSKVHIVENSILNTFTLTPVLSIVSSLFGFVVLLYLRPHQPPVKYCATIEYIEYNINIEGSKEKIALENPEVKHDSIALLVCVYTRFAQNFMQAGLDAFGQPYLMILYLYSKKEIVKLFSQNMTLMSLLSLGIYIAIIFGKNFNFLNHMQITMSVLVSSLVFLLITFPWSFYQLYPKPDQLDAITNSSGFIESSNDCWNLGYGWCESLHVLISPWVYFVGYSILFGCLVPFLNVHNVALYSKLLARKEGLFHGVYDMCYSVSSIFAPLVSMYIYTRYGPEYAWILLGAIVSLAIILWAIFYKRIKRKEAICS